MQTQLCRCANFLSEIPHSDRQNWSSHLRQVAVSSSYGKEAFGQMPPQMFL